MPDTDHWSSTPRLACLAILSALDELLFENNGYAGGGTGCVRSIARIAHDSNPEIIKHGCHRGLPAILLFYGAGGVDPASTTQQLFAHQMQFRLLCLSDNFESRVKRQSGAGTMDSDIATTPGVEELQDWSMRLALRALQGVDGIARPYCQRMNPAVIVEPGVYIGTVDLIATREVDIYDDATTPVLETLGIVHRRDGTIVWDDDPTDTVPDSTWPGDVGGGAPYDPDDAPE